MRWIDELSMARRIVIIVALGLGLSAIGEYLVGLGSRQLSGWYGYAPLPASGTATLPGTGIPAGGRLLIWLGIIALWAVASVLILRPHRDHP
jgi:hypothetical protein